MSFRCEFCGVAQPNGTRPTRIVIEKKEKAYPSGTVGYEIIKEGDSCKLCIPDEPIEPTQPSHGHLGTLGDHIALG